MKNDDLKAQFLTINNISGKYGTYSDGQNVHAIPWYARLKFADVMGTDIDNRFFIQSFTMLALQDGKTFTTTQFEGLVRGGSEAVREILVNLFGGRGGFVGAQYLPFAETSDYRNWQYFWPEGVVAVTQNDDDNSVTVFALKEEDRDSVCAALRPLTGKKRSAGKAYVMVAGPNGVQMRAVSGSAKVDFVADNYSPDISAKFRYMVEQLKNDTPNGRIMIFRGNAGGGKTYLIRSLVGAVERAIFVVVPAAMVGELDGPNLIGTLMNTYNNADGPIVLILEDADSVLAPRASDNMHSISSLLNLSDGILGNLMDLRIIATTNQLKEDLDDAVMRPGRLCVDIEVGPLPFAQAQGVLRRLTGNDEAHLPEEREYQLAELYKLARPDTNADLKSTSKKRPAVGFDAGEDMPKVEHLQPDTLSYEEVVVEFGQEFANSMLTPGTKMIANGDGTFDFVDPEAAPSNRSLDTAQNNVDTIDDALESASVIDTSFGVASKTSK